MAQILQFSVPRHELRHVKPVASAVIMDVYRKLLADPDRSDDDKITITQILLSRFKLPAVEN